MLSIPPEAGRKIVEQEALFARPLLAMDAFVSYSTKRGLKISRERLIRLERLGAFSPVFRVCTPGQNAYPFRIPIVKSRNWFTKGWAIDTTSVTAKWPIPEHNDRMHEAYYSVFQLFHLESVLSELYLEIQLDSILEQGRRDGIDSLSDRNWQLKWAESRAENLREHQFRRATALLCQHISNRYYPRSQTDGRTFRAPTGYHYSDRWIDIGSPSWNWHEEARNWDARKIESTYNLTRKNLRHAYEGLALTQSICDPLENWYALVEFVSVDERQRLKGAALRAETLRAGAHMLRSLHKDLYGEDLSHPNETSRTILRSVPELEMRRDVRRHLEFVSNKFGVNPQPKLSLLVEGRSEEAVITHIFEQYYGAHPGICGIEIVDLGGVDRATGGKEDRFRAIIQLIDYLHFHQTITLLVLDNERYARKLKEKIKDAPSIHAKGRKVTRPEYIKIWKRSLEFDNFSCTEIANALTKLAGSNARFTVQEVQVAKNEDQSGKALKDLYAKHTNGRALDKIKLNRLLIDVLLAPNTRKMPENRPIIKLLNRAAQHAAHNHLPATERSWRLNQLSGLLGVKRDHLG